MRSKINFVLGLVTITLAVIGFIILVVGCNRAMYDNRAALAETSAVRELTPHPTKTLSPAKLTATYVATMTHIGNDVHIGSWQDPFHPSVVCYWVRGYSADSFNCVNTGEKE